MSRRQQENLAGDAFDGSVQTEHQASGEVDEALCVCVVQIRQIHYHRGALTEALADILRFVVGPWMDCRNAVQGPDFDITGHPSHGCTRRQRCHAGRTFVADGSLLRGSRLLIVVVRLVAVVTLVLSQPEVHHRLAQCPSHLELLNYGRVIELKVIQLCRSGDGCSPQNYPSGGREPSIALPTRRCVAPFATAASRSALIPAEIQVASGRSARTQ